MGYIKNLVRLSKKADDVLGKRGTRWYGPYFITPSALLMSDFKSALAYIDKERTRIEEPFLLVTGDKTYEIAGRKLRNILNRRYPTKTEVLRCEQYPPTREYIESLEETLSPPETVFGVGGGTVIDTAKILAQNFDARMISVPTSPAHDGIASPYAVLSTDGKRESIKAKLPF